MTKYVELNAVLDAIGNQQDGTGITFEALSHAMRDVISLKQVDAVPVKHGKWIEYPTADGMNQCSACGVLRFGESYYCPNCGARMDEE